MSEGSFRATKRSKRSNHSSLNKPDKFRVIFKSRSGTLDDALSHSNHSEANSIKMNTTINSFCTNQPSLSPNPPENQTFTSSFSKKLLSNLNPSPSPNLPSQSPNTNPPLKSEPHSHTITQSVLELAQEDIEEQESMLMSMSIEEVERKVDGLIRMKLGLVGEGEGDGLGKEREKDKDKDKEKNGKEGKDGVIAEIDEEMKKIVKYLRKEEEGENLDLTNKKIEILQKIIAQKSIQSQVAKKYYFKKLNTRKTKPPHFPTPNPNPHHNLKTLKQQTQLLLQTSAPTSLTLQSTFHLNYKPPQKSDYPTLQPKPQYIFNNQPMPRSSYGCDYLAYRNLPKYRHERGGGRVEGEGDLVGAKRNSCYRENFTVKKVERIDFKELDCYQDKFRNLKIPLIHNHSYQSLDHPKSPSSPKPPKQIPQPTIQPQYKTISNPQQIPHSLPHPSHYIHNLSTQSHSNFKGEINNIKAAIKDGKLNRFKYLYKSIAHA